MAKEGSMSNMAENFGLEVFTDTDEHADSFYRFILSEGKTIPNYYGYPYIFKSLGKPEYFVRIRPKEEGGYEVCGFDSHCSGNCIWNMVHSGVDLTPEEKPALSRVALMSKEDGTGLIPIELITADVYPSFLKGDRFKIQVIGLPLNISYFPNEEAYSDSLPKDDEGQTWGIANGSLFPAAFLYNHSPEHYEQGFDPETDKIVSFMATVKKVIWGYINITGEGHRAFLRCFIDTQFGELELAHTLDQVDRSQLDNIKAGAIVSGECVISGDLALDEYENGVIKDYEHDLRLLRYSFLKGEEERLRTVLSEDAIYISESTGKQFSGKDEIIGSIQKTRNNQAAQNTKMFSQMATITEAEDGMEYSVGTRCLVLSYDEEEAYEAIAFIDVNHIGEIERIKISTDSHYHFRIDDEPSLKDPLENAVPPESVEEALFTKSKMLLAMCPPDEALEAFHSRSERRDDYQKRATFMWEEARYFIHTGPLERVEILFSNLFVRAFEERLLREINISLSEPGLEEMFVAELPCLLGPEWKERLQKGADYGKQCFKDYKDYGVIFEERIATEETFIKAAVMTQEIGEAYAVKHMEDAPIVFTGEDQPTDDAPFETKLPLEDYLTPEEFADAVSGEILSMLNEQGKKEIIESESWQLHYHFGGYIRNTYIHGRHLAFDHDPDGLSHEIIDRVIERLASEETAHLLETGSET